MAAATGMPNLRRQAPLIAVGALFVLWVLIAACSSSEGTVEERGNALDRQLICPICPGETIDQAQVQIAKDMRKIVREKLAEGESESEIKDFFVARYGLSVLASPPASGFNLLIWIVPPVGLAGALGALYFVMKEMRRRQSAPAMAGFDATDDALAPYLEAVDSEMLLNEARNISESGPESRVKNDTASSQIEPENDESGEIQT